MAKTRVLLDVSDIDLNIGNKTVWICFNTRQTKFISDFKKLIIEKFPLPKKNFNLFLNGGILIENEDIAIIEKGDIIKLQYEENKLLDNQTVKYGSSSSSNSSLKDDTLPNTIATKRTLSSQSSVSSKKLATKPKDINLTVNSEPEPTPSTSKANHPGLLNAPLNEQKADFEESKVYSTLIELDDAALVPNKEVFECPICFTDIAPGNGAVLKDCLHNFCKKCLRGTIQHSDTVEVRCPFINDDYVCDSHLQEQEIKSLVTPEVYDSHLQRCVTYAESQASDSFHCKTPDCSGWCFFENDVNTFQCPVCKNQNCIACAAIHNGRNCKEYQDYLLSSDANEEAKITRKKLEDMVKTKEAMHCPQCQVIITKKGGCNMMTCIMCRNQFTWVGKDESEIIIHGQIPQTSDVQTLVYHPAPIDGTNSIQTQGGIIQIPVAVATPVLVVQTTTRRTAASPSPQTITIPSNVPQGNTAMYSSNGNMYHELLQQRIHLLERQHQLLQRHHLLVQEQHQLLQQRSSSS